MKTLGATVVLAGLALVVGCAPPPLTKAQVDGQIVCNQDAMDQVERAARRTFSELHWVHCPTAVLRAI
jgi:hypothetical protein